MIGEVWLASGQSNMEMDFDYCCNTTDRSELEIAIANFPNIRMLKVERQLSTSPTHNFEGSWEKAIGKNITKFSAAGYFFAKKITHRIKCSYRNNKRKLGRYSCRIMDKQRKTKYFRFFEKKHEVL